MSTIKSYSFTIGLFIAVDLSKVKEKSRVRLSTFSKGWTKWLSRLKPKRKRKPKPKRR